MSASGLYTADELYRLLPAIHRIRDLEHDGVLSELIEVIADQVNALAESLEQMYDDMFIETCAEWIAPYIGDLVGYRTLHGVVPRVASPRAEVANTIRYRRRKGTAAMLEQIARDVTGWQARAVEFFELLVTTQYMNHPRPAAEATVDLRDAVRLEQIAPFQAGAFDSLAHTAEMRRIGSGSGRYNIPDVGIFLWRVQALELVRSPLVAADATGRRYRFDALGADTGLFGAARTEDSITHIAEPFDVPLPLTRRWLDAHLEQYYGDGLSLLLEIEAANSVVPVDAVDVRVCNLSDDPAHPGAWAHEPQPGDTHVAVDPVLGRVAFAVAPASNTQRLATFHYGTAIAVGGGGYDRSSSLDAVHNVVSASEGQPLAPLLATVATGGGVDIIDNWPYTAPPTITATAPPPAATDHAVVFRASNRVRPVLSRNDQVRVAMDPDTVVIIDGLVLAGAPLVIEEFADAHVRTLVLRHCTLVPGRTRTSEGQAQTVGAASMIVLHPLATVTLDHCIVGPVVAVEGAQVVANDSVIDATAATEIAFAGRAEPGGGVLGTVKNAADRRVGDGLVPGGHLVLDACTVFGKVHAQRLDVSDSLLLGQLAEPVDQWPASVWAERRQVGCIRFSYVPPGSRTPRRYECVGEDPGVVPQHSSLRYGDPRYMQLARVTPLAIRTGASDESEMGVTHELYQPQRETNLLVRLDEYLRFGLEAGFFYAT